MQIKLNKLQVTASVGDELNVSVKTGGKVGVNIYLGYSTVANSYNTLSDKPKINDIELVGNKTLVQLGIEPKRGADDFYVTGAEKTQGALATGNTILPTVKKVADRTDRLLVDFTIPVDTTSITFDRDKNGVLFSDLEIKGINVNKKINSETPTAANSFIRFNGVTNNYTTTGSSTTSSFISSQALIALDNEYYVIIGNNLLYNNVQIRATQSDLSDKSYLARSGVNNLFWNKIESVTFSFTNTIQAGSTFKIYRND